MFVDDVADYLNAQSTKVTIGKNLFAYWLPASTDSYVDTTKPTVAVGEEAALPSVDHFVPSTGGGPAFGRPSARVIVRSTEGPAGTVDIRNSRGLAHNLWWELQTSPPNSTLAGSTARTYTLEVDAMPGFDGRDDRGRYLWAFSLSGWFASPTSAT